MNQDSLYCNLIRTVKEYRQYCEDFMEGAGGDEFEQAWAEADQCTLFLQNLRQLNPKDYDACQSHN